MKKTINIFITLLFAVILISCKSSNQYSLDKNISEVGFKMKHINEPIVGKEICTLLYFEGDQYKIVQAYHSCDNYTPNAIDIVNREINCCSKKLYLEGDTVKICLVPGEKGIYKFNRIKLLFVNKQNDYYVADTTFQFSVRDSI